MAIDVAAPANGMKFGVFPAYMRALLSLNINPAYIIYPIVFNIAGNLVVGVNKSTEHLAVVDTLRPSTIVSAFAKVKTAPLTTDILIDINRGGVSIFPNAAGRVTITAAGTTSPEAPVSAITLANLDVLTIDVDQIGTGTVGADLVIIVKVKQLIIFP